MSHVLPQVLDALIEVQAIQSASLSTVAEASATCKSLASFEAVVEAQQQVMGPAIRRMFERISQRSYENFS